MIEIGWTPKSLRSFKRLIRKNPQLRPEIEKVLRKIADNPFQPSLRTHKLTGSLANVWSCSIDYQYRILFEFIEDEPEKVKILLLNMGTHDEVY